MSKRISVFLSLLLVFSSPVLSQDSWPTKPVRWIVPYAAGGFADIRARKIGIDLAKQLGQTVVIENRTGAGGVIGTEVVAKAAPDGYTIGMGNLAALAVNVSLMKKLPYDPLKDLQPVVLIERSALIFTAGPALPANSLQEVIAYAKANPGKLGFGSSGIGGAHHLSGEMLKLRTGIDIVHIPYKGGAPAAADLMAGHLPMMFEMGYAAVPSVKGGKIRALAVTSSRRLPLLPEVPTMAEAGLGAVDAALMFGLVAPAATPQAIVDRLSEAAAVSVSTDPLRSRLVALGFVPIGSKPEGLRARIDAEITKWSRIIEAGNIKPG
jgi:tripartite-type tricarboxylate transporter receptor subunit TctC